MLNLKYSNIIEFYNFQTNCICYLYQEIFYQFKINSIII